ncbi:MAG: Holliday junction branch migration protein RuvA [Deltaproteobacteria bacterium]
MQGTLLHRDALGAVLLVGGVGYELRLPSRTAERLGPVGGPVELWVHTSVKEDALDLFGFSSHGERALFRLLLEVPKVGPSMALLLLSALSPGELAQVVLRGDIARLTQVKGIGRKTAEALLFHLKDRAQEIGVVASDAPRSGQSQPPARAHASDELVSALLGLGYRPAQAEGAARAAHEALPGAELPALLREALKTLRVA